MRPGLQILPQAERDLIPISSDSRRRTECLVLLGEIKILLRSYAVQVERQQWWHLYCFTFLGSTSIVIHSMKQRLLRNQPGSDAATSRDFLRERLQRAVTPANQLHWTTHKYNFINYNYIHFVHCFRFSVGGAVFVLSAVAGHSDDCYGHHCVHCHFHRSVTWETRVF